MNKNLMDLCVQYVTYVTCIQKYDIEENCWNRHEAYAAIAAVAVAVIGIALPLYYIIKWKLLACNINFIFKWILNKSRKKF